MVNQKKLENLLRIKMRQEKNVQHQWLRRYSRKNDCIIVTSGIFDFFVKLKRLSYCKVISSKKYDIFFLEAVSIFCNRHQVFSFKWKEYVYINKIDNFCPCEDKYQRIFHCKTSNHQKFILCSLNLLRFFPKHVILSRVFIKLIIK